MFDYSPDNWIKLTKNELKTNIIPEAWKIKNILYSYHEAVENTKNSLNNQKIDASKFNKKVAEYETLYAQAIKLLFTKEELSYADILLREEFVLCATHGGIIPCDGDGIYIDFEGNELGNIDWNNLNNYPEGAVFIAWYNK